MDTSEKLISDQGVIEKRDWIGTLVIIFSRIIIAVLAVLGALTLYYAHA